MTRKRYRFVDSAGQFGGELGIADDCGWVAQFRSCSRHASYELVDSANGYDDLRRRVIELIHVSTNPDVMDDEFNAVWKAMEVLAEKLKDEVSQDVAH